jgi:response regulator RpfG family c-di-GMP phosphodiesterase
MKSALVLDDTREARVPVVTALSDRGFAVFEAGTSEQALAVAHDCAVDLIIANPLIAGMDSDEFALALAVDPVMAGIPVVFSTATGDAHEVWRLAEACNVSHILITPCEPNDLARFVGEILGPDPRPDTRSQAGWIARAAKPPDAAEPPPLDTPAT